MPGFDATGPAGEGPRTGRGLGRCGPGEPDPRDSARGAPQDAKRLGMAWRRGWGGGRGRGRGFGRGAGWGRPWLRPEGPPPQQPEREEE
jgi:hypothetical protein